MPARYCVIATRSFERDFEALLLSVRKEVSAALALLEQNPFGPPSKIKKLRLRGPGQWRLCVGAYRVRYDVSDREVVLYRVRHRKEVYR